jgi:hypothetical protein
MRIHTITDRELLVGLLNAVGALAERVTGEPVAMRVETAVGEIFFKASPSSLFPRRPDDTFSAVRGDIAVGG